MFLENINNNGLPKPCGLASANFVVLESSTDGVLLVHGTVLIKVAHYKSQKFMPFCFFIVVTLNKIIITQVSITQLESLMPQQSKTIPKIRLLKTTITPTKHLLHPGQQMSTPHHIQFLQYPF